MKWGALIWAMQPLYIVLEVVVGLQASADYSFAGSTVSDLGNTACRTIRGDVLCSPWHAAMNAGFIYFGCTLAAGALLFLLRQQRGRLLTASALAWYVSGAGSIGVGLVPVNENGALHGLVALPVFVAQPAALLLLGLGLHRIHRTFGWVTLAVAALSLTGVVGFAALVGSDSSGAVGSFERLALWPGYVWVSVTTIVLLRHRAKDPVSQA